MRGRQALAPSRRVHLAPRDVDQRFVAEIGLQFAVVRVQQTCPAELCDGDDMLIVRTADVLLLKLIRPPTTASSFKSVTCPV